MEREGIERLLIERIQRIKPGHWEKEKNNSDEQGLQVEIPYHFSTDLEEFRISLYEHTVHHDVDSDDRTKCNQPISHYYRAVVRESEDEIFSVISEKLKPVYEKIDEFYKEHKKASIASKYSFFEDMLLRHS